MFSFLEALVKQTKEGNGHSQSSSASHFLIHIFNSLFSPARERHDRNRKLKLLACNMQCKEEENIYAAYCQVLMHLKMLLLLL